MLASEPASARITRRITFVPTDAWCANSATKIYELCRAGRVTYAFTDTFYNPAGNFMPVWRPAVCVGYLDNAFVMPGYPILMSPDGHVPTERFLNKVGFAQSLQQFTTDSVEQALAAAFTGGDGSIDLALPADVFSIDEEAILLGGNPNFGHFLNEYMLRLPLFEMFAELRDKPILLYDYVPQRYADFMELAGIAKSRIRRIPSSRPLSCKRLWFASEPVYWRQDGAPAFWPEPMHMLRARIMANLPKMSWGKRERIYLPRGQAVHRRLLNEEEVFKIFAQQGFRSVNLADHSAVEQMKLIVNCEALAGPLSAGLSISMLAPSDCAVLQFEGMRKIYLYNSTLAGMALGQTLGTIVGEISAPSQGESRGPAYDDFSIRLDVAETTLKATLACLTSS